MRRNGLWTIAITGIFFMTIFCAGCGKKADPRYPLVNYPEAVSDLNVSLDKDGAVLKWSISGKLGYAGHVRILKSALKADENICLHCPRIYVVAGYFPLRNLRQDEQGRLVYKDRNIRSGFLYSYRVVICDSPDMCGKKSNTAQIEIP